MTSIAAGVLVASEYSGGAEQYLCRLYAGLVTHDIHAVLLGRLAEWQHTGFPQVDVGLGPKWSRRSVLWSAREAVHHRAAIVDRCLETVDRYSLDYLHAQFKREQILLSPALSKHLPVIWTEHGRLTRKLGTQGLRTMYSRAAQYVSCIICVNELVADDVRRVCGPRVPVEVIPNGVDPFQFQPIIGEERSAARRALGLDPDRPVATIATRLHRDKRVERAIEALRRSDAQVVIAGTGPARHRLERLASSRGVDARFLGHLPATATLLGCSDWALVPMMRNEGDAPLAALEAAAAGCHLVGFEGDRAAAFITEAGGVILRSGDLLCDVTEMAALTTPSASARAAALKRSGTISIAATYSAIHRHLSL